MNLNQDISYILSKHYLKIPQDQKLAFIKQYSQATLKGQHIFTVFINSLVEKIIQSKNQ